MRKSLCHRAGGEGGDFTPAASHTSFSRAERLSARTGTTMRPRVLVNWGDRCLDVRMKALPSSFSPLRCPFSIWAVSSGLKSLNVGNPTNGLGNTSNQQGCGGTGRGPCRLVFKEDERYLPVSLCQALCESLSTVFIVNSTSLDVFSMFYR